MEVDMSDYDQDDESSSNMNQIHISSDDEVQMSDHDDQDSLNFQEYVKRLQNCDCVCHEISENKKLSYEEMKQLIKEKCTCNCRDNDPDQEQDQDDSNSTQSYSHVDLASCVRFC